MHRRRIAVVLTGLTGLTGLAGLVSLTPTLTSCGPRAAGSTDPRALGHACRPDLRLLVGACVSAHVASQACGHTAFATPLGCVARPACEPGRARDLESGACVAARDVRALASSLGIRVAEDELLGCPGGGLLAKGDVDPHGATPRLGCLAPEPWEAASPCPPGAIRDPQAGACLTVVEPSRGGGEPHVDVVRWLHGVIGPDGGRGAPPLCGALSRSAGALLTPGPVETRIAVSLTFPNNDVTQVQVAVSDADARPELTVELNGVVAPFIAALRALGGVARQAWVGATVRCSRSSTRPVPLAQIR